MTIQRSSRTRLFVLPVGFAGLMIAWFLSGFSPARVLESCQSMGPSAVPVFVPVAALMMSLLVPKTLISVAAGALFGFTLGSITLSITAVLAAAMNYGIGRWWLRDWVDQKTNPSVIKIRKLAKTSGLGTQLLFRLAPVPTSLISYASGASGAPWIAFLTAAAIGSIPQWLWVQSGSTAGAIVSSGLSTQRILMLFLSVVSAILLAAVIRHRIVKS